MASCSACAYYQCKKCPRISQSEHVILAYKAYNKDYHMLVVDCHLYVDNS